nr:MAG TPA: hypothetical protein [Caudoviricetes sp.]
MLRPAIEKRHRFRASLFRCFYKRAKGYSTISIHGAASRPDDARITQSRQTVKPF